MAMIELVNISKKFGGKVVFDNFNISFEENKITAVLGESGCGKTTLLNIIAGLTGYCGEIKNLLTPISYAFSNDRLLPNLTVEQNLKLIIPDIDIVEALNSVGLTNSAKLYPYELSTGMSRRISLLRAFNYKSKLLLLDEPFANLDILNRQQLMNLVLKLNKNNSTIIFVTHNIEEAMFLSDYIYVLKNGEIIYNSINDKSENIKEKINNLLLKEE